MGFFYGVLIRGLNITQLIKALPAVPMDEQNHHVTLVYIGDKQPSDEADYKVGQAVRDIPCFTVHTGQIILLPTPSRPRVIAIEIEKTEELVRLRSAILNALNNSGVSISDRYIGDFKPHITIAYVRSKVNPQYLVQAIEDLGLNDEVSGRALMIDRVSLIRAKENTYTEIKTHYLRCPGRHQALGNPD
ncbi:MAG: 2'-5' RNA ligase family protein [Vulcanisaeta sp.]|nr:2'-5' RNA ligase family protein [Vulcanisaeta sp.]MCG2892144.1 2'-5' RNA ligase family protein [Vulcanisaeta sp.]MCG2894763.1 2'-5' RNA ligase family protein [Vulcanisaeta sp.]